MSKRRWAGVVILALGIAFAAHRLLAAVLAVAIFGALYFVSCRLNPRVRHRTGFRHCGGSGEIKGWLFPHAFHRCPDCAGGRQVRLGARYLGPAYIRNEHAAGAAARRKARRERRSR